MMPVHAAKFASKPADRIRTDDVWGDGFSNDTFRELVLVRDWNEISRDEYIRIFPNLLGRRLSELSACVADAIDDLETQTSRGWHGAWTAQFSRRFWTDKTAPTRLSETVPDAYAQCLDEHDLASLHAARSMFEAGKTPAYDQDLAERVAFLVAIHPGYVWPEAMISHQLLGSLGWLGIVLRGRPALMPYDIAEFFADAIVHTAEDGLDLHPSLTKRIRSDRLALSLLSSARERLRGCDRVYRFTESSIARHRVPFERVAT